MNIRIFFSSLLHSISIISIFILFVLPIAYSDDNEHFLECNGTFNCGSIQGIGYPFWSRIRPRYCGHEGFELICEENQFPVINMNAQRFRVLNISQPGTMSIASVDIWEGSCPQQFHNISLNHNLFDYAPTIRNLSIFYGCPLEDEIPYQHRFRCGTVNGNNYAYYLDESLLRIHLSELTDCNISITVPVNQSEVDEPWSGNDTLADAWNKGFDVMYHKDIIPCMACKNSGGVCGSDNRSLEFSCFCRDRPYPQLCLAYGRDHVNTSRKLVIAFAGAAISLLVTCIITLYFRRNIQCIRTTGFLWKFTKSDQDIEAFIRNNGTLAPKRFSYSDVRKMTNSFKEKLGKGGYGSVYKGKLLDGHLVAVKVLNTSKGNGQEFINEVASFSRTSHVNVVTLLGFCLEGQKRALIYEFMPNGSLERFIYKKNTLKDCQCLTSEKLYQIATGIARGLEYLHRGCNTRILHFDIKPHNILLDENFCPKISDFGLAKLCTRKDDIVSMSEARGTIGYIAPEVFCRNVGDVSHKSDVYSYGTMILEMVGGRSNIDVGVSQTSEIYFPHWIYRHLEQGNIEPELLGLMTREETEIARKMILIGLWCIQTSPTDRPSMSKVIEMFEGNIEVLRIPPKPYLSSSPPRSPLDST